MRPLLPTCLDPRGSSHADGQGTSERSPIARLGALSLDCATDAGGKNLIPVVLHDAHRPALALRLLVERPGEVPTRVSGSPRAGPQVYSRCASSCSTSTASRALSPSCVYCTQVAQDLPHWLIGQLGIGPVPAGMLGSLIPSRVRTPPLRPLGRNTRRSTPASRSRDWSFSFL
jgi:hypothetical protein